MSAARSKYRASSYSFIIPIGPKLCVAPYFDADRCHSFLSLYLDLVLSTLHRRDSQERANVEKLVISQRGAGSVGYR